MSKGSHITQLVKDSIYLAAKDGRAINIYTALEELTVPQVKQLLNEVSEDYLSLLLEYIIKFQVHLIWMLCLPFKRFFNRSINIKQV